MSVATFVRGSTTVNDTAIVDQFAADANFDGNPNLLAGMLPVDGVHLNTLRILLHFDLSNLPAGAVIAGAVLTLSVEVNQVVAGVYLCSRLTQPGWTENGATWNKYDGALPWAQAGGDFDDTGHDTCTIAGDHDNLVFSNLAALAADAIASRGGQLHLLVRSASESTTTDFSLVWSSEADTADPPQDPSVFPKLVVTYRLRGIDGGGFSGGMQEFSSGMGG